MIFDGFVNQLPDIDPVETEEWLDSLDAVIDTRGKTRARYLLSKLLERARESQVSFPATVSTPYVNTIPPELEPWRPAPDVPAPLAEHPASGLGGCNGKRDRESRPAGEKQRIWNGRRGCDHKHYQRGAPERRVWPQVLQRQRERYRVIVTGLSDPADFAAKQQPREEDGVTNPQDRT